MIEGIQHTPTQAGSHAELQARKGWSVAAMREQMDEMDNRINALYDALAESVAFTAAIGAENDRLTAENAELKKELYNVGNHWSQYNTSFFSRVRNALSYLNLVNCGNVDQAKIECAKLGLLDIDRRRGATDIKPLTKTLTAGEMAQDQTCFIEVSTLAPFDSSESDDYILFHIKSVEGGYIQLHKSKPVVVISEWAEYEPQKRGKVIPLDDWQKAISEATANGEPLDLLLTELAKDD